jgi:hypothetical protein
MIGNIFSSSSSVVVSGAPGSTYVNGYSGAQGVGNMRYNTTSQRTEVFDGTTWIQLNMGSMSIGLSPEVESLLNWARQKRNEEIEREQLAEKNPAIKDLVEQIKQKEDQIKMVTTLLKSSGNEGEQYKPSMVP